MPHKLRKVRKKRASRTHGYGQVGQHRKGSKGRRKAGLTKHGWTYIIKHEPDYFEKSGFTSLKTINRKTRVINVRELNELAFKLAAEKNLEKKGKKIILGLDKLGYDKLLGGGKTTIPMIVKVATHSRMAAKKIEEAGGKILQ